MGKHNKVSKHAHDEEKNNNIKKKVIIPIIAILLLIVIIICCITFKNKKSNVGNQQANNVITVNEISDVQNTIEPEQDEEFQEMDKIGNYDVLGVLKIDKLGFEKNILDETTDESLNLSITKFYGPEINEAGNFCITGHNYKSIFGYLDNLSSGDTFEVRDKSKTITYKIYDKYIVNTDELDCLSQETDGKREVTLITCTPGGITRLIIKAKEI